MSDMSEKERQATNAWADELSKNQRLMRAINAQLLMLSDAKVANQNGKQHVVNDHLGRVIDALNDAVKRNG